MRYEILGFKPTYGQLMWKEDRGLKAAENYKDFLKSGYDSLVKYWEATGKKLEFVRWVKSRSYPEYWVPPKEEGIVGNQWLDIQGYSYSTGYPTEKHEDLIERILRMASNPNDLVLDCFMGSGTTCVVAQELGRRWIGCDINKGAIQTAVKRLQGVLERQTIEQNTSQLKLAELDSQLPKLCTSFLVSKVNDYDLQLLEAEAKEIAVQHLGIQRVRSDVFFDGTLGNRLVKIIDFGHPLGLADIQLIQEEMEKRPEENRNICLVCLGKETVIDNQIEIYNKRHPVNKFEVIELRTDSRYGKFIIHKPPEAEVLITRAGDEITVEIKNYVSPSIVERLNDPESLVRTTISDFRSMIDSIVIDFDYDGKIFRIGFSDNPESRDELVKGRYNFNLPNKPTTLGMKIIDMLGEETIITKAI